MMPKKLHILIVCMMGLAFYACQQNQQQQTEINNLEVLLDSTSLILNSIDTIKINELYADFLKTHQELDQLSPPQTRDKSLAMKLSRSYDLEKSMRRFLRAFKKSQAEYVYSNTQVQNLVHDLEQKLLEKETYNTYYQAEKKAIESLAKYVVDLKLWENTILQQVPNNYSLMTHVTDSLSSLKK